jgi:hypothetical protein
MGRRVAHVAAALLIILSGLVGTEGRVAAVSSGINWYYAGTDFGGTIRCAGVEARVEKISSSYFSYSMRSFANRDVFCLNADPQPADYIQASGDVRRNGAICVSVGYTGNPAGFAEWGWSGNQLSCGSGSYQTTAYAKVARILSWRYGSIASPSITM